MKEKLAGYYEAVECDCLRCVSGLDCDHEGLLLSQKEERGCRELEGQVFGGDARLPDARQLRRLRLLRPRRPPLRPLQVRLEEREKSLADTRTRSRSSTRRPAPTLRWTTSTISTRRLPSPKVLRRRRGRRDFSRAQGFRARRGEGGREEEEGHDHRRRHRRGHRHRRPALRPPPPKTRKE